MKTKNKPTQADLKAASFKRVMDTLKNRIDIGSVPKNPTRLFKVGESVRWGNHKNVTVTEVLFDGLGYLLHYDYMGESYGKPTRMVDDHILEWMDVFPLSAYCKSDAPLHIKDDIRINFFNNDIGSLMNKVYNTGVDFNPDYQRDLVWSMEQKLALIDSIFNNVDIGKFTFIHYDFNKDRVFHYEILDGKQRLSTILEFYEDRFTWNGKKFSELCFSDAHHFTGFPIIQGEVSQLTDQQIYRLFIKMNTSGTPVSNEHLDKIKSLIK